MKKKLISVILLFLFFPLNTKADTINYDIKHYYINADIVENGDMKVTELIVLKGNFNGYIRDILYKNSKLSNDGYVNNSIYNAKGISIIEIAAKRTDSVDFVNDQNFIILTANQASNLGYLESSINDGKSYKMYFKSNNDTIAFKITYYLKDVIVAHEDVAELYWTFIGENYEDKIEDLQIRINLPTRDSTSNFRVWAHGDLAGEIKNEDNRSIIANLKKLDSYSSVDIRSTFDLSIMNGDIITKKNNDRALEKIIEVETKRANEANKERKEMKIKYYLILFLVIIWFIALIVAWIYVYLKYDKEYKKEFVAKYNREFIDDYNVEVIDYLFSKSISSNAMSASIMNLVYKKNIKVTEISSQNKKKEYEFSLLNNQNLTEAEICLIDFLFNTIGKDNKFTTIELKNYAKNTKTCEKFSSNYTRWKNKVIKEGVKQNFYEIQSKPKIFGILFFFICLLINIISIILKVVNIFIYIAFFFGIIFLIYTLTFNKRTKKGNEHYAKWTAFKNFLNDFGTFELKELPEIILWERYMVYATLFGLAKKVSKVMNVRIKEIQQNSVYMNDYGPTFMDWYIYDSINTSIVNSIQANTNTITSERVNSISSNGSGFGGGFSSGGGFGGGGGGGRGF